ncbi:peptidoglycan-binding domain-containing protein [Oleisolibacter albus]|uniref:peptidoglycan-binding domain-containing protein n=1 Tax=Oleisolibacter albus TaxID=2171757 RepID=UPI0013901E1B|nr:peptidoglycan-binding domain-containing protein [Oleisolibacter albus]
MTRLLLSAPALAGITAAFLLSAPADAAQRRADCPRTGLTEMQQTAMVKAVQQELAVLGFDTGRPDGRAGRNSVTAIRHYQSQAGLQVDGCPSPALLDRLRFALPKVYSPHRPQEPTQAVQIQEELLRRGYWPGPADGRVGPRTRDAIRQFEIDSNRPVIGEPSSDVLAALKTGSRAARRD